MNTESRLPSGFPPGARTQLRRSSSGQSSKTIRWQLEHRRRGRRPLDPRAKLVNFLFSETFRHCESNSKPHSGLKSKSTIRARSLAEKRPRCAAFEKRSRPTTIEHCELDSVESTGLRASRTEPGRIFNTCKWAII